MKIPLKPPNSELFWQKIKNDGLKLPVWLKNVSPLTGKGEYLHWDTLRHLPPPAELTSEEWWVAIQTARHSLYKALPFVDKENKPFVFAMPDPVLKLLHTIDCKAGYSSIQDSTSILTTHNRDFYLTQSLIEEAITSSQLEGASTTSKVAKEMLQTKRKPKDVSEQMILNNYRAIQFVRKIKNEPLTPENILALQHIVTENTLKDGPLIGCLRSAKDDIHVIDKRDNQILHIPPKAEELEDRLKRLCIFANTPEDQHGFFMHPLAKAIILHFMLAYDHPFVDGNGRTARALFYWFMLRQGYLLIEFISISSILKKEPGQYARAFLYTETDRNDLTYFILHQLEVILKAIDALYRYIDQQNRGINEIERLLEANPALYGKLNYRQIALIKHALKHPQTHYRIEAHRHSHQVTYDTARNDLLNLAKLGFLLKQKIGKAFVFMAPADIKTRIEK